jgi:hypothetical protein
MVNGHAVKKPLLDDFALYIFRNDLAIATHGRGFYILDNIGPLRQRR